MHIHVLLLLFANVVRCLTDGQINGQTVHLFDSDHYAETCFGLASLNPQTSGWMAIWAIYTTVIQYLPMILSLGFIFIGLMSKSTVEHFLSNTITLSWFINICLEYKFRVPPIDCAVSVRLADVQLLGPAHGFPPIEITQSIALITFFMFYIFFWKNIWVTHVDMDTNTSLVVRWEMQENMWIIIVYMVLLIQNPLLLWIRSVYSLVNITIGIVLGLLSGLTVIMVYSFYAYMYDTNKVYKLAILESANNLGANYPLDNPFSLMTLLWITNKPNN